MEQFTTSTIVSSSAQGAASPLPSPWSLFKEALSFYIAHKKNLIGIAILPAVLYLASVALGYINGIAGDLLGFAAEISRFIVPIALFAAFAEDGEPVGGVVGAYKKMFSKLAPYAWTHALVVLAIIGGFFAFFVPAFLLSLWLYLTSFTFWCEGRRGIAALASSWHYVKGYFWAVFWRTLAFGVFFLPFVVIYFIIVSAVFYFVPSVGISCLSSASVDYSGYEQDFLRCLDLPLTIGSLFNEVAVSAVFVPLGLTSAFILYKKLREIKTPILGEEEERGFRRKLKLFITLGVAGLAILLSLSFLVLAAVTGFLPSFLVNYINLF